MKTVCLLVVALWCAGASARAAEPVPAATLHVYAGRHTWTFQRAADIDADDIESGVVHADLRRGKHRYLLISDTVPSHPAKPMGHCGGGVELFLYWLDVVGSTVARSQTVRYVSCWQGIEGDGPVWAGSHCSVHYKKYGIPGAADDGMFNGIASFDANAPEKGLEIIEQPAKAP